MSVYNNRVRSLSKKRQLELIALWDYVDNARHCIDLRDNTVQVHERSFIDAHNDICEDVEDNLEEIYYDVYSI